MTPVATVLRSQFVTAARRGSPDAGQGSGVIIFLTAIPARLPLPGSSGIGAAYGAVEAVTRTLAMELGPAGVRVVCLRTTANPDTRTIQDATEMRARMMNITPEQALARLAEGTMLKVLPQTADTARAAVPRVGPGTDDDRHRPQRICRSGHRLTGAPSGSQCREREGLDSGVGDGRKGVVQSG